MINFFLCLLLQATCISLIAQDNLLDDFQGLLGDQPTINIPNQSNAEPSMPNIVNQLNALLLQKILYTLQQSSLQQHQNTQPSNELIDIRQSLARIEATLEEIPLLIQQMKMHHGYTLLSMQNQLSELTDLFSQLNEVTTASSSEDHTSLCSDDVSDDQTAPCDEMPQHTSTSSSSSSSDLSDSNDSDTTYQPSSISLKRPRSTTFLSQEECISTKPQLEKKYANLCKRLKKQSWKNRIAQLDLFIEEIKKIEHNETFKHRILQRALVKKTTELFENYKQKQGTFEQVKDTFDKIDETHIFSQTKNKYKKLKQEIEALDHPSKRQRR